MADHLVPLPRIERVCAACGEPLAPDRLVYLVCPSCNWFRFASQAERAERVAIRQGGDDTPPPEAFAMEAYTWNPR